MISILYVDDEAALLEIAKLFLETTGQLSVDTCTSPVKAKEILTSHRYDAIVSDYQMPVMDGIEFLKYIRAHHGSIPFILFTGKGREEIVIQALDNGADFYLQKGGDPRSQFAELQNKIVKAVKGHQAVAAQRDSERRLADIINFLPDATLAIDAHGIVIAWNCAMEQMTGVSAKDILGKGNYEYALPFYNERRPILLDLILDFNPTAAARYDAIKHDGNNLISEKFIPLLHGGRGAYLWFIASPFYDAQGHCTGAIESIRDITDHKRMESSLRASERQYHNVFESAAEAMIVVDRDSGKILDANTAAIQLYGYTRAELLSLSLPALTHEHERMIPPDHVGMLHISEQPHKKKDGTLFPAEISGNVYPQKRRTIAILTVRDSTRSKQAADALIESEGRFRALAENASDIIRILDPEGRIVFETAASGRLLGYPEGYMIGKSPFEFIHPADLLRVKQELQAVYAHNNPGLPTEFRIRRADGTYSWVESTGKNLTGVPGVDGIMMTTRFIDGRKQAEMALVESEGRYRTLVASVDEAILLQAQTGEILTINRAAEQLLGITVRDVLEHTATSRKLKTIREDGSEFPGSEHPSVHTLATGEACKNIVMGITNTEGRFSWVNINTSPLYREEEKKPYAVVITLSDITERKRAEAAQKKSEEKFHLMIENSHDIIYTLTSDGVFTFVSPAWTTLLGYPVAEVVGRNYQEFVHPEDIPGCVVFLQSVTGTGQRQHGVEYRVRHLNGTWYWHTSSAVPTKDEHGTVVGIYGIAHDITGRKRVEEALRQANRQLNLLSSITRHDIRNQLVALKGYIELSRECAGDNTALSDFLAKQEQAANTIEHQITFTGDYQDLGVAAPAWQNVNASIQKAVAGLPMRDVRVSVDRTDLEILADLLFVKVFYNLIDNALRYGGAGMKTIRVLSQEHDTRLLIVCEDDGVGITAEDKKRLFTRGFGKNTGLGLFLSREILAITGITITENGTPGKGAWFEITVPKGAYRFTGTGEK